MGGIKQGVNHYQGEGSHLILLAFCGGIMPLYPYTMLQRLSLAELLAVRIVSTNNRPRYYLFVLIVVFRGWGEGRGKGWGGG